MKREECSDHMVNEYLSLSLTHTQTHTHTYNDKIVNENYCNVVHHMIIGQLIHRSWCKPFYPLTHSLNRLLLLLYSLLGLSGLHQ